MRLTFIGTSHGVPEPHRRCASYMLEVNGAYYIIDMGTQTIEDLMRLGVAVEDVRLVICTHPHGDHTDGVISFVDLLNWKFKEASPIIMLPWEGLIEPLKAWVCAVEGNPFREGITLSTVQEGVTYQDDNVVITAVRNQHCANAFSYFVEAEGKRILFTGDLKHPSIDFPAPAFELDLDLIVCELAHFTADDAVAVLNKTKAKRVIHAHIAPRRHESLARQLALPHPYEYGAAEDGLEIVL